MRARFDLVLLWGLVGLSWIVSGCHSEYALDRWEEKGEPDTGGEEDECNNIWCQEWSEIPDVYFAVAWIDPEIFETTQSSQGSQMGSSSSSAWAPEIHYDIIDLRGQVVAEFTFDDPNERYSHLDLVPGPDGTFYIAFDRSFSGSSMEADGFSQDTWWEVWQADGRTGVATQVLRWDPVDQVARLPQTGQALEMFPGDGTTTGYWHTLAADPVDPDRMMLWSGNRQCVDEGVWDLRAVHTRDASVAVETWGPDELLSVDDADDLYPFTLSSGVAEQGAVSYLLGVTEQHCYETREHTISSWRPGTGQLWEATLPPGIRSEEMSYTGLEGGHALHLGLEDDIVRWHVTGGERSLQGTLNSKWWNMRPGPMLHPDGPAFIVSASTVEQPFWSRLHVMAGGKRVWSIEQFKIGLDKRNYWLLDVGILTE